MKKTLLFLSMLFCFCYAGSEVRGAAPESPAKQIKIQQNRHKAMTEKFSMNYSQLQQYDKLIAERDRQLKALDDSVLPWKERQHKEGAIRREFSSKLEKILTADQLKKFHESREEGDKTRVAERKIRQQYYLELHEAFKTRPEDRRKIRADVSKKYEGQLAVLVGHDRARALIRQFEKDHDVRTGTLGKLGVDYTTAKQVVSLNNRTRNQKDKLVSQPISNKERIEKIHELRKNRDQQTKKLLGESKFVRMQREQDKAFERKCLNMGFTSAQFAAYRNIQNLASIERLKVQRSKAPKSERDQKLAAIEQKSREDVRKLLPADVYAKWELSMIQQEKRMENRKGVKH